MIVSSASALEIESSRPTQPHQCGTAASDLSKELDRGRRYQSSE